MTTIALRGAAGKIGMRIANRVKDAAEYRTHYVEASEGGLAPFHPVGPVECLCTVFPTKSLHRRKRGIGD
jgi:hypothetical protein